MDTSPPFSLRGKSIFITGGASGIGLGTCQRCVQEGARVIIADIQPPPQSVLEAGATYLQVDVTNRERVIDAFKQAEASVGKLHAIIHNAGKPGNGKHLTDSDEEVLDGVVALNFYGTYYILKYGPGHMHDGGSIVVTASVAGLQQNEGFYDYSATKAANISMVKTAAVELGRRGIRCNAIAPGPVKTPMLPPGHILNALAKNLSALGRIAEIDDLVGVYHFLASDQSRYITGQTLVVDGGRLAGFRTEVLGRLTGLNRSSEPASYAAVSLESRLAGGRLTHQIRYVSGRRDKGIELGAFASHNNPALVGKLTETFFPVVTSHAAHAHAAKAQRLESGLNRTGVHRSAARHRIREDMVDGSDILAKDIDPERTVTGVDVSDDLLYVVIGDHREDGPEDLFLHDAQIGRGIQDERDRHSAAFALHPAIFLRA